MSGLPDAAAAQRPTPPAPLPAQAAVAKRTPTRPTEPQAWCRAEPAQGVPRPPIRGKRSGVEGGRQSTPLPTAHHVNHGHLPHLSPTIILRLKEGPLVIPGRRAARPQHRQPQR